MYGAALTHCCSRKVQSCRLSKCSATHHVGGSGTVPAPDQGVAFFISVLLFSSYISYKQLTLSGVSSLLTLGHNASSAKLTLENHEKNSTENLSVLSVYSFVWGHTHSCPGTCGTWAGAHGLDVATVSFCKHMFVGTQSFGLSHAVYGCFSPMTVALL